MLTANLVIRNRYEIIENIGKGSFGEVYRAYDKNLKMPVALKRLIIDKNPDAVHNFEREAQRLAELRHLGLPRVTDYFVDPSGNYLVMDFIEGEDLTKRLERNAGPLPVDQVLGWADQLFGIVGYLHGASLVHNDIKPDNIKVKPDGKIFLLDIGIARSMNPGQTTTHGGGYTEGYASIGQVQGDFHDPRNDIYALGATLYHLLTNTIPTNALERVSAQALQGNDPLRPAHMLNPNVPEKVSAALQTAMAQAAAQRFGGVAALRNALRQPQRPVTVHDKVIYTPQQAQAPRPATFPVPAQQPQVGWGQAQPPVAPTVVIPQGPAPRAQPPAAPTVVVPQGPANRPQSPAPPTVMITSGLPAAKSKAAAKPQSGTSFVGRLKKIGLACVVLVALLVIYNALQPCNWLDIALERSGCIQTLVSSSSVQSVAFVAHGNLLAAGVDDSVQLWDQSDGKALRSMGGHTNWITSLFSTPVNSVALTPDGETLAAAQGRVVQLWRVADATQLRSLAGHSGDVWGVAFSPDGQMLASSSDDGTLRLWNVSNGKITRTLQAPSVRSLAFSPDAKLLASGSSDGRVRLWQLADGALARTLEGHTGSVNGVAFAPDGQSLASGSADGTVRLWNIDGGKLRQTFSAQPVQSVTFTADGQQLISGSTKGGIRLWQVTP